MLLHGSPVDHCFKRADFFTEADFANAEAAKETQKLAGSLSNRVLLSSWRLWPPAQSPVRPEVAPRAHPQPQLTA